MNPRNATVVDVAKKAGVSPATVSRTLMNPDIVSAKTRAAVEAAIRETGYRVNVGAQNLRRQRTRNILVLTPNLTNGFYFDVLAGVSSSVTEAGFNLLVGDGVAIRMQGNRFDVRHYLDSSLADGIIVMDSSYLNGLLARPETTANMPIVLASLWLDTVDLPSVRVDNGAGSALAIDYLAGLGHHRIGHIRGPDKVIIAESREAGMRDQLAKRGLAIREDWFFAGGSSMEAGRIAAGHWAALAEQERPTAVYCYSDNIAIGFMGAVQQMGFNVPGDVSVVGFDGIELGTHLGVPLTTISQPRFEIGVNAAEMLLARIGGSEPPGVHHKILPVELVVRGSTAPHRKNRAGIA